MVALYFASGLTLALLQRTSQKVLTTPHDNYFDDVVPDGCDLDDLDNADLYCVHVYLSLRISVYVLVNLSMVPFCLASLLYFAPLPSFE